MPSDAGVVPETTEETPTDIFDVSAEDIAQAAGMTESFIDSDRTEGDEESETQNEEESEEEVAEEVAEEVEESEDEQEVEEEDEVEEEEPKGDSPGIKKRIGKLVERAKRAEAEQPRGRNPTGKFSSRRRSFRNRQRPEETGQDGSGCRTPERVVDNQSRRRRIFR